MSVEQHKNHKVPLKCAIITVSDTRTEETDKSGNLIIKKLISEHHIINRRDIVKDDQEKITALIKQVADNKEIDVILMNGGTGISYRDVTYETVKNLLDKELSGFGELFRMLSYQEDIGSAAILSRAIAGVCNHTAVFATPGSSGAVKLAMDRLILPELNHVVNEIKKDINKLKL